MSPGFHDVAARVSIALLFLIALCHAGAACALTVDDLDPSQKWKLGAISTPQRWPI